MRHLKYLLLLSIFAVLPTHAYLLGFKSADNTIENIQTIEQKYKLYLPIVGFIFDPWDDGVLNEINQLPSTLGTNRIYHMTISPNSFSAQQVISGMFDNQYTMFFKAIKKNNLKVVFRTMHEMNGGRYPRSSNPALFKKARIHVRDLSREIGLSTGDILFDMSVNHWDMPTRGTPSQSARLIPCQLQYKAKLNCYTFEDYYPGDKYVDLMGFTFYNRGKGNSDRKWMRPQEIVNEKGREVLRRLKTFHKPIVIDEVGTTAVRYTGDFNMKTTREMYKTNYDMKNKRLYQFKRLLRNEPAIIGAVYFNVDYTNGLTQKLVGEADRAVVNIEQNKAYNTIFNLINNSEDIHQRSSLANLFGVGLVTINDITTFITPKYTKPIKNLRVGINKLYSGDTAKIKALNLLTGSALQQMLPNYSAQERQTIWDQANLFIIKKTGRSTSSSSK